MRTRYLTALLTPALLLLGLSILTTQAAYAEGTPDGETPANEGVCDDLKSDGANSGPRLRGFPAGPGPGQGFGKRH